MKKWVGAILLVLFLSAVQRAGGTGEALGWLLIILLVTICVLTIKWLWTRMKGRRKQEDLDLGDLRDIVEE